MSTCSLLFMRNNGFVRTGSKGPSYTVMEVDNNYSQHIYRYVKLIKEESTGVKSNLWYIQKLSLHSVLWLCV